MSRSRKGSKGPGYDYWTPRPGNNGMQGYGPEVKRRTHRLERLEAKKQCRYEPEEPMLVSRPCLVCRKLIEPTQYYENGPETWENEAVSFQDTAGYGSKHDCSTFNFVICDDCISNGLSDGRIINLGEQNPFSYVSPTYEQVVEVVTRRLKGLREGKND